ncbi:unnamed protein product [Linum trigynum]|uniref:Uncharacterized protein n=1 Tax=Linum trigynum TaxID=586398 RepID=A0AAV2FUN7_9ROSI
MEGLPQTTEKQKMAQRAKLKNWRRVTIFPIPSPSLVFPSENVTPLNLTLQTREGDLRTGSRLILLQLYLHRDLFIEGHRACCSWRDYLRKKMTD